MAAQRRYVEFGGGSTWISLSSIHPSGCESGPEYQSPCPWCVLLSPLGTDVHPGSCGKRSHYKAEICDPVVDDMDYPESEEMLKRYPLDLVGISTYTHSLPDVQMTINLVRKQNPNAKVVLGGPHCAMFPDYAIQLKGRMRF